MRIPFTADQFFDVFRRYHDAFPWAPWILSALGLTAVLTAFAGSARGSRVVSGILAVLWLWMALAYHLAFFAAINPVAPVFGAAFALQSLLFFVYGVVRGRLRFRARQDVAGLLALLFVGYAVIIYPALGYAAGQRYPAMPTFGLPCPTVIFTFGLLVWAERPLPRVLLVVPVLWTAVASTAAFSLGVVEDYGLLVAGVLGTALVLLERRAPVGSPGHGISA
jgi:hypothetical protein